jgi:hypothetical protein
MSVLTYEEGDRFVVRVFKHHTNNPDNLWTNSYEGLGTTPGSGADLLNWANSIVAFEAAIHMTPIQFDRFTISTWEADSVPYDPLTFMSVSVSDVGATGEVNGMMPINTCLSVARVATSGRFGHLFYRGVLDNAETAQPAGKLILLDASETQTRITAALTSSSLADYLGVAPDSNPAIVLINKDGSQVRNVVGLVAVGITTLPTDHAWFNRTSP